jgi:uncharacterized membrane protein
LLIALAAFFAMSMPVWSGFVLPACATFHPFIGVIMAVLVSVGVISVVLSANSTVVQSWLGGGREVYHLYSVSNIGSFAGLLSYPLLIEPFVSVSLQWQLLGVAIVFYGVLLVVLLRRSRKRVDHMFVSVEDEKVPPIKEKLPCGSILLWIVIPAISCALMTAVTTYLTTDFIPLPLMWAFLLASFLLSYVIGFSKRFGERLLGFWVGFAVCVLLYAAIAMQPKGDCAPRFYWNCVAAFGLLFVVCTALHSWLFQTRPGTKHLPAFYFCISFGGCLGGVATGVVAPVVFDWVYEYSIMLVVVALAFAFLLKRNEGAWENKMKLLGLGILALTVLVVVLGRAEDDAQFGRRIYRDRGFYGVTTVTVAKVPYRSQNEC